MAPKRRRGSAKAPPRPKHVLSLASPAQRIVERAKIGSLTHALIQPATLKKYRTSLAYFFHYLAAGGLELPSSQDDLDDIVCDCIEHMWETGESRTLCGNLLSSIPYHSRALTGRLKGAWRLYQLWGTERDSCSSTAAFQSGSFCHCPPVLSMGIPQCQHRLGAGILPLPEDR